MTAYRTPDFDALLDSAAISHDRAQILNQYSAAESMLMDDAVVYPLLVETQYFVLGKDVTGIDYYPYGGKVVFRDVLALR